ncbi:tRNA (guanine(37)-N(1))-methyltransferase [Candidatus Phytoplasma oryzae]|uniref:tRNA (guanine-N(1)-)-methyltransferase n=1 Tax=Candidatus Phytoplasma oryzae TaxID=203274 RepID=A0A139JQK1_9MOLU|nr:tRNA (guanosine(37)-N1)-methyltransferase TrmD [Candidatus Phytoplasma oryzae]KXT29124.1 tRNA (guanine(37)-N(1))-methyltransferase [Candidatus Phytoplasma oryzae]RAM57558.1 tRNA (guanine-N1)-methyltransferase [Candidatus Phytoplasma oryzae]
MIFDIITIFPNFFDFFLHNSIIKRAYLEKKIIVNLFDLRKYSHKKNNQIDDSPYGGGAGMLLAFPPFYDCLSNIKRTSKSRIILLSPQGNVLKQEKIIDYAENFTQLIILCGNYEGVDARILKFIDEEVSIGDYILTGGEISAMVFIDSITRILPGVIKKDSYLYDSFQNGLLKYPQYTRPQNYKGEKVPSILLSGNHQKINEWRQKESLKITFLKRPDLFKKKKINIKMKKMLADTMIQEKEKKEIIIKNED